jgi:23S rRNA (pseudouridine1915-N3)-methyltransferase
MKIVHVAVGRVKEKPLRDMIEDYYRRIRRYVSFVEVEIPDGEDAEVEAKMRKAIPPRARVVALEVEGMPMSSDGLAQWIGRCELSSTAAIAFLIGGSDGLPAAISKSADLRLSLSKMTLPHRIARLVLAEQIYRAYTILRGEPYAR